MKINSVYEFYGIFLNNCMPYIVNHMDTMKNELTVFEAYTRDIGRGIARIDNKMMDELGLSKDDIIEIKGKRRTVARCLPPLSGSQLAVERMQLAQARKQMHKTHLEEKIKSETGFVYPRNHPHFEKLEKLKVGVEQYEKELLAKQDEIKYITRNMLNENCRMEEINEFLNSNRNESLISTFQQLLSVYRQYVAELEATISKK